MIQLKVSYETIMTEIMPIENFKSLFLSDELFNDEDETAIVILGFEGKPLDLTLVDYHQFIIDNYAFHVYYPYKFKIKEDNYNVGNINLLEYHNFVIRKSDIIDFY